MREQVAGVIWYNAYVTKQPMCYDEALDAAKNKAEQLPLFERDGRKWVTVEGHDYPKDWFVKNCAFLKTRGEV